MGSIPIVKTQEHVDLDKFDRQARFPTGAKAKQNLFKKSVISRCRDSTGDLISMNLIWSPAFPGVEVTHQSQTRQRLHTYKKVRDLWTMIVVDFL